MPLEMESPRKALPFRGLKWCPGPESNQRHCDFQSHALPTELPGHGVSWSRGGAYRGLRRGRSTPPGRKNVLTQFLPPFSISILRRFDLGGVLLDILNPQPNGTLLAQ